MGRPRPGAESPRYATVPGILACRACLRMRSDAADLAVRTQPRAENLRRPARRKYSPPHRPSKTTAYKPREMKMPRRSLITGIDYALQKSARDNSCCPRESIALLRPSKD